MAPNLQIAELRALANIVEDLDYYQLLEVERRASAVQVRTAYHAVARRFHPDRLRQEGQDVVSAAERIAKRVAEAYAVLRDPRRRKVYDQQLDGAGGRRLALVEGGAQADRQVSDERQGRTPNGRRYITLAQADLARADWPAAQRNLQMALTFEGDNAWVKEKLAELKQRLEAERKKNRTA
jgi:curved DNA-binding protein CbpA